MKKIIAVIDDPLLVQGLRPLLPGGVFAGRGTKAENAVTLFAALDNAEDRAFVQSLKDAGAPFVLIVPAGSAQDWRGVAGAADVFTPPLRLGQLADRVLAHAEGLTGADSDISVGPYVLVAAEGVLVGATDKIHLTEKERDIIMLLHAARGKIVERKKILDAVWGYVDGVETHTLETHIYRLRRKIEHDPAEPEIILTEEAGYRLAL